MESRLEFRETKWTSEFQLGQKPTWTSMQLYPFMYDLVRTGFQASFRAHHLMWEEQNVRLAS